VDKNLRSIQLINDLPNVPNDLPNVQNRDRGKFKRIGISNQGNTCYLNATLQVLRNSLCFPENPKSSTFGKLLAEFYKGNGKPNAIINFLEQKLRVSLREQSDAAVYLDTICRVLEEENSNEILEHIKITNIIVTWKCTICSEITRDNRGASKASYSIILTDGTSLNQSANSALHYIRKRTCQKCNIETAQTGTKSFSSNHLVFVPQSPKTMNLRPLFELRIENLNMSYELIGIVLHRGSGRDHYYGGGHYIAVVKDRDVWYRCNDKNVDPKEPHYIENYYREWTATVMIYKPKV